MRPRRDLISIAALERLAGRRLPAAVFDGIAGGAGDEITLQANRRAWSEIRLMPRVLEGAGTPDLTTTVLGRVAASPVLLAPAGLQRIVHPDAELAAARAAGRAGIGFALASVTSHPLEAVALVPTSGPRWFQLYQPAGDRAETDALVARAAAAGYDALCVTVDTAVRSFRERDARHGFSIPPVLSPRLVRQAALRPGWTVQLLRGRLGQRPRLRGRSADSVLAAPVATDQRSLVRPVTWADLTHLRAVWSGPLVVKGVLRADQARRLVEETGVDGVVVSNHGGRILDSGLATAEALPDVVAAVDGRAEVFVDGGIRRGTDIVKALALGARGCLVGRPYLYGLATGGEAGVATTIELLHAELSRAMALLGLPDVGHIDRSAVRLPEERWGAHGPVPALETTTVDVVHASGGAP